MSWTPVFSNFSKNPITIHYTLIQFQIIDHPYWNRYPKLYQKGLPLTLTMNIFSVKVLRFTIWLYRTVDLMKHQILSRRIGIIRKKGEPSQKHHMVHPHFSKNVKTNVGNHFFKLLKKHFGKKYYHKIFNKSNIKVSYSLMENKQVWVDARRH